MAFCTNCGKEIDDRAVICPGCGVPVAGAQQPYMNQQGTGARPDDESSMPYGLLGFFIPILGLILFLVWNKEYPKRSKSCGKGALISIIVSVVVYVLAIILIVVLAASIPEFRDAFESLDL